VSTRNIRWCRDPAAILIGQHSAGANRIKRKQLVRQVERKLIEHAVRAIIFLSQGDPLATRSQEPDADGQHIFSS
jgi:hypothetical protein